MKDRDDLIESRIERIMGDVELLKTEINELDLFQDEGVLDSIQADDAAQLGTLIMRMIEAQVMKTAILEIDEEAQDREEARMESAA